MAAGLLLGWLLTRTNPKVGLLVTSLVFVAAVGWALVAAAQTYLFVFGAYGAGELVGVYAPNYILSFSRKADMRRNMAFVTMMMVPAAPAGYLFGLISDECGARYGKATGFHVSFVVCALIMLTGIVLAVVRLPARPPERGPETERA
jgi:MFS family permease